MNLKEALKSHYPPYYIYGKVLTSENGSFRLEKSLRDEKVYVAPATIEQILNERCEVLDMLRRVSEALKIANPLALDLLFDQEIED